MKWCIIHGTFRDHSQAVHTNMEDERKGGEEGRFVRGGIEQRKMNASEERAAGEVVEGTLIQEARCILFKVFLDVSKKMCD